jgi:uncharacterized DUF497 family protein
MIDIEFDPVKDQSNQLKHGLSLALATMLDWDAALVWLDDRFDDAEYRMIALAPDMQTVYYVAFVDLDERYRIISLRKATRQEVLYYVKQYE